MAVIGKLISFCQPFPATSELLTDLFATFWQIHSRASWSVW